MEGSAQLACSVLTLGSSALFIQVIDKSFGFDTTVEEAQRAIKAAHVEAESCDNGIGVVKLIGRQSGETHMPCRNSEFLVYAHSSCS